MSPGSSTQLIFRRLRHGGLSWLFKVIYNRVWPARPAMIPDLFSAVQDRAGLEIGGPIRVFSTGNILPVYRRVQHLDNVNFSSQTAWEDGLRDGGDFRFDPAKPPADLREWRRVTSDGGHLLLILPNPRHTFDHRRPTTTLAHLREDSMRQTGEDDLTHLPEIFAQHDLALDPPVGSPEQFQDRSLLNAKNRCLHHHVFDLSLMSAMLAETGWYVLALEEVRPIHLLALAQKQSAD